MRPIGYLYKRVARAADCNLAPPVEDVFSLSRCISNNFCDYINFWRHNGFWLFDSPAVMEQLAREQGISLDGLTLFYYEGHELEYVDQIGRWVAYEPDASFVTQVVRPPRASLAGFDVVSFCARTCPECSPLSCNNLATELPVNSHCLFSTFDDAIQAIESGEIAKGEPGPHRVVAVYTVNDVAQ